MIGDIGSARHNGSGGVLQLGDAVVLTRGQLTGLTGVLERFRPGDRCLIRVNAVEDGVLLLIDLVSVARCSFAPDTSLGSDATSARTNPRDRNVILDGPRPSF